MQKLKTEIEKSLRNIFYSAKMKLNLQRRNNLNTIEHFQGCYPPRGMFNPLGISDEFLFRNNFNDKKIWKIFPHSRESFPCRVTFIWRRKFTAFVE